MWPFKKNISLKDSGMFEGMTDWHSHILPGVDDGIKTIEESLEVLSAYEALGLKRVWLTPHIMEDYPNETADLRRRFEELERAWTGKLELRLASENMLDNLFEDRLEANDFLPIGEDGTHLLVETSYYTPPMNMDELLEEIMKRGYYPVLAHPERYRYMDEKDYKKYRDMGILFQSNYVSLAGGYGKTAQKKIEWLLKNKMVDVTGSDVHRLHNTMSLIKIPGVKKDMGDRILSVALNSPSW